MKSFFILFLFIALFLSFANIGKAFPGDSDEYLAFLNNSPSQSQASSSSFLLNSFLESIPTVTPASPASTLGVQRGEPTLNPGFCMNIPVFLYHHTQPLQIASVLGHAQLTVDSNVFDEQVKYLKDSGYNIISAEDLVYALQNYQKLPNKTLVITIDDGYDDNYTYAFSIAKKHEVVMNFMIPTSLIGTPGYMTWEHLKEMKNSPYAKIYNHTASHAALGYLSGDQIEWELNSSSQALKDNLGLSNTIFTYPYGSYNDLALKMIKKHGFIGAFTTIEGNTQCKSQIMLLQRQRIGNTSLSWYGF